MKAEVKNVTGSYLNTPAGEPWAPEEVVIVNLPDNLIRDRIKLGLYSLVREIKPPRKKKKTAVKRFVPAEEPKGERPADSAPPLADILS